MTVFTDTCTRPNTWPCTIQTSLFCHSQSPGSTFFCLCDDIMPIMCYLILSHCPWCKTKVESDEFSTFSKGFTFCFESFSSQLDGAVTSAGKTTWCWSVLLIWEQFVPHKCHLASSGLPDSGPREPLVPRLTECAWGEHPGSSVPRAHHRTDSFYTRQADSKPSRCDLTRCPSNRGGKDFLLLGGPERSTDVPHEVGWR